MRVDRILLQRRRQHVADFVLLGEEDLDLLDVLLLRHRDDPRLERLVGLEDDLAGLRVDDVAGGEGALELGVGDLDRRHAGLFQRGEGVGVDLLAGGGDGVTAGLQVAGGAQPLHAVTDGPRGHAVLEAQAVDRIEAADDLVGAAQAERAQEDRRQELALAVDAHVEQVLGVVLELDPRAAIRNDLRDVERLVFGVEEGARRAVQLADDDTLGAVDDERAVVGHQRDVAVVDLLLLDVADGLHAGLGVLVPDDETDRHLERHGVGHAAFLALVDVVLQLETNGIAADVADVAARVVGLAAARAQYLVLAVGIGDEGVAAAGAGLPQVMQALEPAALALPVANRVLDELQRRVLAEVANREHRLEDRLQPRVFTLGG